VKDAFPTFTNENRAGGFFYILNAERQLQANPQKRRRSRRPPNIACQLHASLGRMVARRISVGGYDCNGA